MAHHEEHQSGIGRIVSEIEETAIALILGLMTIITFINVVLRYGFNTGIIWGLEVVTFLFAWLVLFGMSYAVKVTAHLGVDAVINLFSGAGEIWAPFAALDATSGRWFPTGFENSRDQAWYEVIDTPLPEWLRFIEPIMNQGEEYEKLPRFIPYAMLPFGVALLLLRFVQAFVKVAKGTQKSLIVSHEAEDAVEDVKHMNAGD